MKRSTLVRHLDRWANAVRSEGMVPQYDVRPGASPDAIAAAEAQIGVELSESHRSSLLAWDGFEIQIFKRRNPINGLGGGLYQSYAFRIDGIDRLARLTTDFRSFAQHAGIGGPDYTQLTRFTPTAAIVWNNGSYAALISRVDDTGPESAVRIVDLELPRDVDGAFRIIAESFDEYLERTLEFLSTRLNFDMYWE